MTRWVLALLCIALAVGLAIGVTTWRRAQDRAALARTSSLLRDVAGYPDRMRREQVELVAERERLERVFLSREADALVEQDLRALPEWQAIETELAAAAAAEQQQAALRRELAARSRIALLRGSISELEAELERLGAVEPRPPGEDE